MKHYIFAILFLLMIPQFAFASVYFSVEPAIIDKKGHARDILSDTITLTNKSTARLGIYTFVNNVDAEVGQQEFKSRADVVLADSLANWIEISRGVAELAPGESVEIPVTINVNLHAKPGQYHARISFGTGSTRAAAEAHLKPEDSVLVNVEVVEDIKERLQLDTFSTGKIFFGGSEVSFAYDLQNTGNKDLQPQGEVRIYDRRGKEIGSVPANVNGTVISPNDTGQIASVWNAGKSFGKYKALLDIEYGQNQLGTVNDTIYFWIVPWKKLLAIFLALASLVGGGTYYLYQRYEANRQPQYIRVQAKAYKKVDEDSLLVPQHTYTDGTPKPLSDDHLLNLRS